MARVNIGEIKKLVCVGDGDVAAIGTKGTYRFFWELAHSKARVDELGDIRLNMALRYAYGADGVDLATALPRGAVIPLPSGKRARTWMKRGSGPKQGSRWFLESAIEAGFKPRYYLGEKMNPYPSHAEEHCYWHYERAYLCDWPSLVVSYISGADGVSKEVRTFVNKIHDWQTRVLVTGMVEDEMVNGDWRRFEAYVKAEPLL